MCNCLAIFPEISLFKWISCINHLQNIFDHWINSFPSCFEVFIDIGDCLLITTTASSYSVLLIHVSWHSPRRQARPISSNYFCNWICSLFLGDFLKGTVCSRVYCVFVRRPSADGTCRASFLINFPEPALSYLFIITCRGAPCRATRRVEEIN